jgi:hypothetical protein
MNKTMHFDVRSMFKQVFARFLQHIIAEVVASDTCVQYLSFNSGRVRD